MKTAEQVFVSLVGQDAAEAPGRPPAGPLLAAGDLLLMAAQEPGPSAQPATLFALGLADGQPRWHKDFSYALVSGLAAAPDGLILVTLSSSDLLRGEGMLLVLDGTGEERYRWAPGVQRISAPAVAGDLACVTADGRMLVLLDPGTGAERGRVELGVSASASAPALWVGEREGASGSAGPPALVLVPCRGPQLLAVWADGRVAWRFEAAGSPEVWLDRTPLVVGERVYAVLTSGAALALQLDDGGLLWQEPVGPAGKPLSAPASDGERLYVGARDGLYALALADGHAVWHFSTARRVEAAPVVAGGVVYAACHDHHLYALDAASGSELWRYEVGRRIEVPPLLAACGDPPRPCVVVTDHGGTLTAVARPLSAEEFEAAGQWLEAAAAYAARGLARKRAEMLERQARSLEEAACGDVECGAAWKAAVQAWEAEGETERAAACQQAVERCRHQPAITLDVRHEGLVLGAWSRLQFSVRNEGYGPARNLVVHAQGEQFEGQVTQTRRIVTLQAGQEQAEWLDVRPRQHGDSVPLRLRVEYQDQAGEMRCCERAIYIAVARSEAVRCEEQTVNVFVGGTSYHAEVHGSGAVAQGAGAVAAGAGGVAVGGDVQGAGGKKQEARGKGQEADDIASLRRQLEEALENLRLIEERKSQYVMAVDVPLQFVKEERRLRERIAELERQLAEAVVEGAGSLVVGRDVHGAVAHEQHTTPSNTLSSLRLDAAVPEQVYLGQSFDLAVAVRQPDSPLLAEVDLGNVASGTVQVEWPSVESYVRLRVQVSAPDCEVHGPDSHSFRLHPGQDSPVFYFHLTPKRLGEISIIIKVFQEDDWLGSARVHTLVRDTVVGSVQLKIKSYQLASCSESARWNTAAVRDLLSAAFSDEELVTFCFDCFPAVYEDLGSGMGKGQKVQRLLEHCLRRGQMEELLARVHERNPAQYARFAKQLGDDVE